MSNGLRVVDECHADGCQIGRHSERHGELLLVTRAAVRMMAGACAWLVPAGRAAWLAPGVAHRLLMRGEVGLRCVQVPRGVCGTVGPSFGLRAGGLLGALVAEMAAIATPRGGLDGRDGYHMAVGLAFVRALERMEPMPLRLDMPRDRRAERVAVAILADPARAPRVGVLVRRSGGSLRTVQRLFLEQTGMGMAQWRRQARLMAGAGRLLEGGSVGEAARMAGYERLSAFCHAFHARFGETPAAFRAGG